MNDYGKFASIYDRLIKADIDYGKIAKFVENIVDEAGFGKGIVLDLACGSGILTEKLKKLGYDMIGIDLSVDMLNIAKENNPDILYLCQDMREFELYGTVDCICCMTDALNYITEENELLEVFRLAKNYLNPGAPFVFDMNSVYKFENILSNNTFTYEDDEVFYVWENEYDEESKICEFYLTFFVRANGKKDCEEMYERFDEMHKEKAYSVSEVENLLRRAGFSTCQVYSDYEKKPINGCSERYIFVAF